MEELYIGTKIIAAEPMDEKTFAEKTGRSLMAAYGIPISEIYGHRDFNPQKSCPGEDLYSFLQIIKGVQH